MSILHPIQPIKENNRIDTCFESLKVKNKCALITFITAGDPMLEDTVKLMHVMSNNGVDIIELGVPFSDPMADGPTIQRSSDRAVKSGVSLVYILEIVEKFRQVNQHTPIVLMGYANTFNFYENKIGTNNLAVQMHKAGIDGILLVDMPPESDKQASIFKEHNIYRIYIVSPTTTPHRIEYINKNANGFIYYVSVKGVTGSKAINTSELANSLPALQEKINLPIAVGFGIDNAQKAKEVAQYAQGIVIGSKIINLLEASDKNHQEEVLKVFLQEITNVI